MNRLKMTLLGVVLGTLSQAALAFQETTGKAAPESAPSANIALPAGPSSRGTGAEIRVPGLGPIGTLPKFDFGLELLYGANEPRGLREELNKADPSDVQIRGTIKYKFNN